MSSTALFRTDAEIAQQSIERSGPIPVETSLGAVSVRITGDLPSVEAVWEELQAAAPCTSAQTFDWAQAWVRHVLRPEGREPVIVVGRAADGQALLLWPFEMAKSAGIKVLHWLGQAHANYNMGLFVPEAATGFTPSDISGLLSEVARASGAAAAILNAQPFSWDGVANPFAGLNHQLTPSSGYAVTLGDFDALYEERFSKRSRSTLNRKERKLADAGPLSYGWAETRAERLQIVDAFFAQRARQFAAMGVKDIFDAHARAFYREVALLEGDNPSRLRLGYIKVGDAVLATFSGTVCHGRVSVVLCSLADGDLQRQSPGALLLRHQIEEASANGLTLYDIGVGAARHKDEWADVVQPLFDSFIAFKPHGLTLTLPLAALMRLKRAIKSNQYLWPLAQKLRTRLLGKGEPSA
jgi:CelD/BcsL family acetyltransferase involved in cellulose biosynthesis